MVSLVGGLLVNIRKNMGFIDWKKNRIDQFEEVKSFAKASEEMEAQTYGSRKNRRIAAEFFGTTEFLNVENKEVLKVVIDRKNRLVQAYRNITNNLEIANEIDAMQFLSDLFIYTIVDTISNGTGIPENKVIITTQKLMSFFKLETKTSASEHVTYMTKNEKYKRYMDNAFNLENDNSSLFWIWIAYLSMCDESGAINRVNSKHEEVSFFINEYGRFLRDFSYYINQLAPGRGCGVKNRTIISEKITDIRGRIYEDIEIEKYLNALKNPLYFDNEDIEIDMRDLINSEVAINKDINLSTQSRVKALIKLIDMTAGTEQPVLKNYYEHMISAI